MLGVDSEVSHISRHRCELASLLSHVLVSFPVVLLKHPKTGNLREEGLLLVHPRGQSIVAQESRQLGSLKQLVTLRAQAGRREG